MLNIVQIILGGNYKQARGAFCVDSFCAYFHEIFLQGSV